MMLTHTLKKNSTWSDFAAIILFACLFGWYAFTVRYGLGRIDESFYLATVQRIFQGDRFLVNEWHPSQFSSLFLFLPYWVYVRITGGTAGIILYMRYVFLASRAVLYWFLYGRLRRHKGWGIIAAVLYCGYVPFAIFTSNYYNMSITALLVSCLLLMPGKKDRPSVFALLCAGFIFACSVLIMPAFALLYFVFTLLVWIAFFRRRRTAGPSRYALVLHERVWLFFTAGVLVCAALFLTYMLLTCGIGNIVRFLPYLFTDPEYEYGPNGNVKRFMFRKFERFTQLFGTANIAAGAVCIVCLIVCRIAAAYLRRDRQSGDKSALQKRRRITDAFEYGQTAAVLLFCFVLLSAMLHSLIETEERWFLFTVCASPALFLGLVCCLLQQASEPKYCFLWITALSASVCAGLFSDVSFSLGDAVAYVADVLLFADLLRVLRAQPAPVGDSAKSKRLRLPARSLRAVRAHLDKILLCTGCVCLLWSTVIIGLAGLDVFAEHWVQGVSVSQLDAVADVGPYRGIHTTAEAKQVYKNQLADIDRLRAEDPSGLYVFGNGAHLYLYAQMPCCAYSTWSRQMHEAVDRQITYWSLHPEKTPRYIYIPADDLYNKAFTDEKASADYTEKLSWWFGPYLDYEIRMGKQGCFLEVKVLKAAAEITEA